MRILGSPHVYLVSRPQLVVEGVEAFLADNGLDWPTEPFGSPGTSGAEQLVELAGRNCYMSFGAKAGSKTNRTYIDNLVGFTRPPPAHGSVLEHANYSFIVTGAGRGFSHEQVRHRVGWAYSQLSTRYCDFEREEEEGTWDPGFVVPPLGQLSEETESRFRAAIIRSRDFYNEVLPLIEKDLRGNAEFMAALSGKSEREQNLALRKAARGAARDVLPIATEAIMTLTGNVRTIYNCAYARANEHAEAAIRNVYVQILQIMRTEFPPVFDKIEMYNVWDGTLAAKFPREKL